MRLPDRRDSVPVWVQSTPNSVRELSRIQLRDHNLNEGWLQHLLFDSPRILPVNEIAPNFGPLIPLGMEVGTDVGRIDALFVAPSGLLTIVETKLWTNPQARREVVAQVIDYAKEVSLWSYDDLDQRVLKAQGQSLWDLVQRVDGPDSALGEASFIDEVSRNLRRGRFLLLIVGEGIHEDVERMASFLQQTPHLHFNLALVELRVYQAPNDQDLLVVPSVVARTEEIIRAVVRVERSDGDHTRVDVNIAADMDAQDRAKQGVGLDENDFLDQFEDFEENDADAFDCAVRLISLCRDHSLLDIRFNAQSFAVLANVGTPKSGRPSLLTVGVSGVVKCHATSLKNNIIGRGVSEEQATAIHDQYIRELSTLLSDAVLSDGMNLRSGPHLNLVASEPWPLEILITDTVEAINEAMS